MFTNSKKAARSAALQGTRGLALSVYIFGYLELMY